MSEYGCFTTVLLGPDGVRGWQEHLRRLARDSALLFDRPVTEEEVVDAVREAAAAVAAPVALRISVTAADHALGRPGGQRLRVSVTARPVPGDASPLSVLLCRHRRALPEAKHLGITAELAVRRRAQQRGFDDALFTVDGAVTEGPTWAVLLALPDGLVVPTGGLPSTTVALVARALPVTSRRVAADELTEAFGAVALNAAWGVRLLGAIDGRPLAGRPADDLLRQVSSAYAAVPADPL